MSRINYVDEFRNPEAVRKISDILSGYNGRQVTIMEVCGTHTMAISRFGIRDILPKGIRLISGPGCPVCVTPSFFVDAAVELSRREDVIIATFGDMMRVPGTDSSLVLEKARGSDIRVLYSPLDCIKIALDNPNKKIILLSVGFETTTPVVALAIDRARDEALRNFSALCANKTIPQALKLLASDKTVGIDGYLYPGHVSAITGTGFYQQLAREHGIPGAVAGFEPLDIVYSIYSLANIINEDRVMIENRYSRVVRAEGNPIAVERMYRVFEPCDSEWRGIGVIPGSGLSLRDEYSDFDAWKVMGITPRNVKDHEGCMCGEILKGKRLPGECKLFGRKCTPENPVGACMVSSEGTCAAYYRYGGVT